MGRKGCHSRLEKILSAVNKMAKVPKVFPFIFFNVLKILIRLSGGCIVYCCFAFVLALRYIQVSCFESEIV